MAARRLTHRLTFGRIEYQEVKPIMITTYERGIIQGQRVAALLQLEEKLGTLSPAVRQRVDLLSPEELRRLLIDVIRAQSLRDLGLEDDATAPAEKGAGDEEQGS